MISNQNKGVALVLGSGGARGLAHIGVIKALEENHIPIDMIIGTSIGALIGGLYASGMSTNEMERIVQNVDKIMVAKILMPKFFSAGFIDNNRVIEFINKMIGIVKIEDLKIPFAAVATDFITGEEVVINSGFLIDAIISSIAIPIIFHPVNYNNRYLIDGGLSNPLPVSLAIMMKAKKIIAVNVLPNPERITKKLINKKKEKLGTRKKIVPSFMTKLFNEKKTDSDEIISGSKIENDLEIHLDPPTMLNVLLQSISISSNNLLIQSLNQAKPDLLISPDIEDYDLLEFYKGTEIIKCGYEAGKKSLTHQLPG